MLLGGPDYEISAGGRSFRFEMHPVCGPVVLNKRGDPTARQPGPKHEIWRAVTLWHQQGRRVVDGVAQWDEPTPDRHVHIVGRQYWLASHDDPRTDAEIRDDILARFAGGSA